MSANILGAVSHQDAGPGVFHSQNSLWACGPLGSWGLQRQPHQRGLWYVQLHIRGLSVCGYAVQDDFGALQFVEVS